MKVCQRHGGGNFAQNGLIGGGGEGDFAVDLTKYMKYRKFRIAIILIF